jgi:hypothetical protein
MPVQTQGHSPKFVGAKNSTFVGAEMLVKCHDEPENYKLLYDHGTTTFSLWEMDIAALRKKMGRIDSLLISQCQKYEI